MHLIIKKNAEKDFYDNDHLIIHDVNDNLRCA